MATSNTDGWDESLGDIDDLLGCVADLETEDVVYLEEYLNAKEEESEDVLSTLHPLSSSPSWPVWDDENFEKVEDLSIKPSPDITQNYKEEDGDKLSEDNDTNTSNIIKNEPSDSRATRVNRGVTQPKFVSYQVLPPTKGHGSKCEVCGLVLSSLQSRRRHILTQHIKQPNNICHICGKAFVFKYSLETHKGIHAKSPSYKCVCRASFKVRSSYMDHVNRIHNSTRLYTCHLCFKSFNDRCTLRVHLVSVHKPKTVACEHPGCPKVFSTRGLMHSHYRYHLNKRFTCDECGKDFSTEAYMYKHRRTHSGIRPHRCLDCGQTYLTVSHLNKHRKAAHSNVKPYQCSICGKCFKTRDNLIFHESSHRGEKPFKCTNCGYATAYRNTYYAHRKKCLASAVQCTDSLTNENFNEFAVQSKVKSKKVQKIGKSSKTVLVNGEPSNTQHLSHFNSVLPQIVSYNNIDSSSDVFVVRDGDNMLREGIETESLKFICFVSPNDGLNSVLNPIEEQSTENIHISPQNTVQISLRSQTLETNTQVLPKKSTIEESSQNTDKNNKLELSSSEPSINEPEKSIDEQESFILVCNIDKCAVQGCENNDSSSLLIFKTDDNSYISLCSQHALVDSQEESGMENKLDNESKEDMGISATPVTTILEEIDSSNSMVPVSEAISESNIQESHYQTISKHQIIIAEKTIRSDSIQMTSNFLQHQKNQPPSSTAEKTNSQSDQVVQINSNFQTSKHQTQIPLSIAEKTSPQFDSAVQITTASTSNLSQSCTGNLPIPSDSKLSLEEHLNMLEFDSGVPSLSGHIEDSFSLAQLEVQCPLCDQSLTMDAYVTHLECCQACHN